MSVYLPAEVCRVIVDQSWDKARRDEFVNPIIDFYIECDCYLRKWVKYTEEIKNLHFEWSNLTEEIEQEKVGVTLGGLEEKGELEKLQIDHREMRAELEQLNSLVSANTKQWEETSKNAIERWSEVC